MSCIVASLLALRFRRHFRGLHLNIALLPKCGSNSVSLRDDRSRLRHRALYVLRPYFLRISLRTLFLLILIVSAVLCVFRLRR